MNNPLLYRYDNGDLAHSYKWHLPFILNNLQKKIESYEKKLSLLEVGCGNGSLGKHIIKNYDVNYHGIDISYEGIEFAKKGGFEKNFTLMDASNKTSKLNSTFDICISIDVIEHIVDLNSYIKFIKSHLKKSGTLILTTTYHSYYKWLALAILGKISSHLDPLWPGGRCKFFDKKQLNNFFSKNDFILDISTSGKNFIPSSFHILGKKI